MTSEVFRDRFVSTVAILRQSGIEIIDTVDPLSKFMHKYGDQIGAHILSTYRPLYNFDPKPEETAILDTLGTKRKPLPGQGKAGLLPAQRHAVTAMVRSIRKHGVGNVQGEMGWGKASKITARVYTPTGYKHMGDIQVGDQVINPAPTLNNVTITGGASISGTGSNTVDAIYATNGVSFYMAALPLDSGTTNFVVSLASTNSVLDISAAADVHFMHATNLIAGVAASALVRVMNDGAGNITVSCNPDWHANGFEFTLTNDTVAVVTIQSFGGTAQTIVYAARAWFD